MPSQGLDAGMIAARIGEAAPCWWPGLAAVLEAAFWDGRHTPIDRASYGSWRWLTGDARQSRTVLARLGRGAGEEMIAESLPRSETERYTRLGLTLRSDTPSESEVVLLTEALLALTAGDGALETVQTLVRSVHLLASPGNGYDISHSNPELPFSIFVSLPLREEHSVLRLAEAILHEAMHLQLTLIESQNPIFIGENATAFSPWQQMQRPISGLVHGLYVFRAIDQWLARVSDGFLDEGTRCYVARRRRTIAEEIDAVRGIIHSPELTSIGLGLVRNLLAA